jgi:hypothetical protein
MKRLFMMALLLACAGTARAQGATVEAICPIDGERFRYETPPKRASSETYLDQRPVDPAFPWPYAKCPTSGFVVYLSNFPKNRLSRLQEYVKTDEYQRAAKVHTTHYLEALMRRQMGDSPYSVAYALLQASWEVAGEPERYKQYAGEALAAYDAIPLESLPQIRERIFKRLISGELARRLGRFDSAESRFLAMRDAAELSKLFFQKIVELQLKLVRARDSSPQRIPYN